MHRAFSDIMFGTPIEVPSAEWSPSCSFALPGGTLWDGDVHGWPTLFAVPEGPGPFPCFVGLNFNGNWTLTPHPVAMGDHWTYPGGPLARHANPEAVPFEYLVSQGWAVMTTCAQSVAPDDPVEFFGRYPGESCIGRWAWGLSVLGSALWSLPEVGSVVAFGHSRLGKTALLAAARDERFAGCVPVQSGCGGLAPSRTTVGETVGHITRAFPHWFLPEFASFAGREEELPVDQHHLAALVLPRRLYAPNAQEDTWANPLGQREMLDRIRPLARALSAPDPLWSIRPGDHALDMRDWPEIVSQMR